MEDLSRQFALIFEGIGLAFDLLGVLVILVGVVLAGWRYARRTSGQLLTRQSTLHNAYQIFKIDLGHTLLLGLEILVAADIIKTVALAPSFTSLGVLAVLVVIRTFLSWSLILEIEGRFPWQTRPPVEGA